MKRAFAITLIVLISFPLSAQIQRGGKPMLYRSFKSSDTPFIVPEDWTTDKIKSISLKSDQLEGKKPLSVAVNYPVDISPGSYGTWHEPQIGFQVWRFEIISPNARAINVFFKEFDLEPDARIFVYDPLMENILGGFTHLNNKSSGVLNTSYIPGNRLIMELQVPSGKPFGKLKIGSIGHAFIELFDQPAKKDGYFGRSGECEVDVNCTEGEAWQIIKHSVCRIIFRRNEFTSEICTGSLINNTASDGKALLYTANHCIRKPGEAESAVLIFDYESTDCNGEDGNTAMSISGTEILATSDSLDFSLLLLSEAPPESYKPYYAGWSVNPFPPHSSVTIHHPSGDVKKISVDRDPAATDYQLNNPPSWLSNGSEPEAFWRVINWEAGATEGGSSGCPLFNSSKRIVGNLTGGDASCSNPVNDYFSKFHKNWDYYPEKNRQLKYWLDSINTGSEFIDGYDPFNIHDPLEMELFELFPNPGKGLFTIYTDTLDLTGASIRIMNLNGKTLSVFSSETSKNFYLNLTGFENGIYILEIRIKGYLERKKIVLAK